MKTVLLFLCLVLRKITKHCSVQVKLSLEVLSWKAPTENQNVAIKLLMVSVIFCCPYGNELKVSSSISCWKAIYVALGKVFYCTSLPELGSYQKKLWRLCCICSYWSWGGASLPLHPQVPLGFCPPLFPFSLPFSLLYWSHTFLSPSNTAPLSTLAHFLSLFLIIL